MRFASHPSSVARCTAADAAAVVNGRGMHATYVLSRVRAGGTMRTCKVCAWRACAAVFNLVVGMAVNCQRRALPYAAAVQ